MEGSLNRGPQYTPQYTVVARINLQKGTHNVGKPFIPHIYIPIILGNHHIPQIYIYIYIYIYSHIYIDISICIYVYICICKEPRGSLSH